ncbi:MAG: phosphatase PAP2 family protein [Actinomycetota bacterium]|nr:phosphatase PAP2 family protein [Actinomycetota bacterium]
MRRWPLPMLAAVALLLGGVTAGVLDHGLIRRVDWWLHLQLHTHFHHGPIRALATVLAATGQRGVVVVPLVGLAVLAARRHRTVRPLVVTVAVIVGLGVGVYAVKYAVGRSAPSRGSDVLHSGGRSFPSGHAVDAVVCWGLVLEFAASLSDQAARVLPVWLRRTITGALAAATGLAMLVLDYHWLSDALAGWLLGLFTLTAAMAIGPVHRAAPAPVKRSAAPEPIRPAPSA